jgi:U3 small nucleolar RNA-associated protein 14|tara:strand:+ start:547 stop:876 length:330 start_codon:yes stop_codon:yes gene_type:complete
MIVDVTFEDDTVQIARIIHEHADMYAVNFLVLKKRGIYEFSSETELVPKDSISGFYDVDKLENTNMYYKTPNGYEMVDDTDDNDYECSDSEDSESESLVDDADEDEEEA